MRDVEEFAKEKDLMHALEDIKKGDRTTWLYRHWDLSVYDCILSRGRAGAIHIFC